MHNPNAFARKVSDQTKRGILYVPALTRTIRVHLPETVDSILPRTPRWHTYRLRPEIVAVIEALQVRHEGNSKDAMMLTASEALAAVIAEGLPIIASKTEFR